MHKLTHFPKKYFSNKKRIRGQGVVEYALILALVGLVVIAIVNVMEPAIAGVFSRIVHKNVVAPPALAGYTPPPTNTIVPTIDETATAVTNETATAVSANETATAGALNETATVIAGNETATAVSANETASATITVSPTNTSTSTATSTPGPVCSPTGVQMAKINFQRAGNPVPSGYDPDIGEVYGPRNGFIYGWNIQNDLGRDRDDPLSPDQRYDTLTFMQQNNNYFWEFDVPNGVYEACIVVGDAANFDSVYRLNVEGSLAVNFNPSSAIRWGGGFVSVHVTDGRITISNASGAVNNKVNFVDLYQVSVDPTPEATNTATATATATSSPTATATATATPTSTAIPGAVIYVSSNSDGTSGGVSFADEDILRYDETSDTWFKYIDLGDVGISDDLRAFMILDDGSILMSFTSSPNVPGVGTVDDSDIVRFVPTQTGPSTSGTFSFYFDGSDVGLGSNSEDIDALTVLSDGRIIISTDGDFSVSGVSGKDEDLIAFTPTSLGSSTSGTWAMYFDGSDISGLGGEDLNSAWIDPATGRIYQSVRGNFSVAGVSGDESDIFACTPISLGTNTNCTYDSTLFWDGSLHDFGGELLDGLSIELP
jgi:Flp pilus assembly pilin Flp